MTHIYSCSQMTVKAFISVLPHVKYATSAITKHVVFAEATVPF